MDPSKLPDKKEDKKEKLRYLAPPPPKETASRPTFVDSKNDMKYSCAAILTTVCAFLTGASLIGAVAFSGRSDSVVFSYMSNSRILFSGLTAASLVATFHYREKDMELERARNDVEN
ncbi:uncharacterized protein LOC132733799 [Ruditapes philippinarum]|uniref:uncharacterized protein LOC132733799 n=1 Tax=Ruditapes philippinarum TaxID=129788 RepID=UPI00295B37B4|nr:uncharacterized protein LOC132733799 [Ruditapes philippinarum]